MLCRCSVGNYVGNELTHDSSRNARPQSSQLAEPLLTDPGLNSGTGAREMISTKKKDKEIADVESSNSAPKSSPAR